MLLAEEVLPELLTLSTNFLSQTDANATDVGDLTLQKCSLGQSSTTHGYSSGGHHIRCPRNADIIDKFPFAADGNATDVGDLDSG